jgi:glutamine cyclotransferase
MKRWISLKALSGSAGGLLALAVVLAILPFVQLRAEDVLTYRAEVVNEFPHDPNAFTQGLIYWQGQLYEGTGQYGESTLRRVELETGELLQRRNLDARYFGEGITILNDRVYQLTWRSNVGFVYDLESFEQLGSFYLPGEGWGITHDGEHLIVSDGTANLRFLDPHSLDEVRRIEVTTENGPVRNLNELEYINGEIWANIWYQNFLVRIDPQSGRVNSIVDLSDLNPNRRSFDAVLNGIAWDAVQQRLFVTGKLWSRLYEIRVLD